MKDDRGDLDLTKQIDTLQKKLDASKFNNLLCNQEVI